MIMSSSRMEGIADMVESAKLDTLNTVRRVLQIVGIETVMFLRSLTDRMRPPVAAGEGWRRAHPGGWADVTGNLANAYAWEVREFSAEGELQLVLTNSMEYAAYLDAHAGYFVLKGVADPGGPVERAIRTILARVAPDIEVVSG